MHNLSIRADNKGVLVTEVQKVPLSNPLKLRI
jgi:hypothetical protein